MVELDIQKLIGKAKTLKSKGHTEKEICAELHINIDTVRWLLSDAAENESPNKSSSDAF